MSSSLLPLTDDVAALVKASRYLYCPDCLTCIKVLVYLLTEDDGMRDKGLEPHDMSHYFGDSTNESIWTQLLAIRASGHCGPVLPVFRRNTCVEPMRRDGDVAILQDRMINLVANAKTVEQWEAAIEPLQNEEFLVALLSMSYRKCLCPPDS